MRVVWWPSSNTSYQPKACLEKWISCSLSDLLTCASRVYWNNVPALHQHRPGSKRFPFASLIMAQRAPLFNLVNFHPTPGVSRRAPRASGKRRASIKYPERVLSLPGLLFCLCVCLSTISETVPHCIYTR